MSTVATRLRSELMGLDKPDSAATPHQLALRCLILGRQVPLFFDPTRREAAKLYALETRLSEYRLTFETSQDERLLRILARKIPRLAVRLTDDSDGWLLSCSVAD